jgi:hypothetical protein
MESRKGSAVRRDNSALVTILPKESSNKFRLLSLGVDYKLAPGFMPYAEANWFSMKEGRETTSTNRLKNAGFIILAGTKLHF